MPSTQGKVLLAFAFALPLIGGALAAIASAPLWLIILAIVAAVGIAWALTHPDEFQKMIEAAAKAAGVPLEKLKELLDKWFSDSAPSDGDDVRDIVESLPKGKNKGVRTVPGDEDVEALYDRLARNGEKIDWPNYDGEVVRLPDGTEIGLRGSSRSGGKTIDIKYPDGSVGKVHRR
ncbi:hypothetical protein [Nocardia brasiliensis]|uniref:hypothetical protein n=1 Tax=Nocardia brasiliensis TaxID=37326 RepID=UPI0004A709FA|nr:hypothetical protein [Nocardia brasiliensis]